MYFKLSPIAIANDQYLAQKKILEISVVHGF